MIRVFDDVLADPVSYRERALSQDFGDVRVGPDTFRGIAMPPTSEVTVRMIDLCAGGGRDVSPKLTFLRKSPAGQHEPNFIHSDVDMGDWTGIYYMNPVIPAGDGTAFWALNGAMFGPWTPEIAEAGRRPRIGDGWGMWKRVGARFNRLVVFKSDLYHSRAIYDNYGKGDGARLIQVVFA